MLNPIRSALHDAVTTGPRWRRVLILILMVVLAMAMVWAIACKLGQLPLSPLAQTWIVAIGSTFIATAALVRNFLLGPHTPRWPVAPAGTRSGIVVLMVAFYFIGLRGFAMIATHQTTAPPLVANPGFTLGVCALAYYKAVMLWGVVRQVNTARYWQAMARASRRLAACHCLHRA